MDSNELLAALREYETHAVDLVTGKTTSEHGGYEHVKELIGYPPYVVSQAAGPGVIPEALAQVYKEMGAVCSLKHGVVSKLGDMSNGLCLRPEDVEVKVYNPTGVISAEDMISRHLAEVSTRPAFMNLKWHDNNFYSSGTNWAGIYYEPGQKGDALRDPPYDLSLWTTSETNKSEAEQNIQWDRYEDVLNYVKSHPETFTAINARDVINLLAGINQ